MFIVSEMSSQDFSTLAYSKSPKTTRRTTFQDELHAAISARATKKKTDEDDFFNELLKSRKKISDAFKAGKSKTKINDFELSDDEGKNGRRKKVSFLKTSKNDSPSEDTTASEPHEHEQTDSSIYSFASKYSTNTKEDDKQFQNSGVEFSNPQTTRHSLSKSLSNQTSDDAVLDLPSPLPSDSSVAESQRPSVSESRGKERKDSDHEESSQMILAADLKHVSSADSVPERQPPRPKPRQRTLGLSLHATEKIPEDTESQDIRRPETSSDSILLSADTSSNITKDSSPDRIARSCCSNWTDEDHAESCDLSKTASSKSEQSHLFTTSTFGSGSRDGFTSDDSNEQERKYSTSLEKLNEETGDHSVAQLNHVHDKSSDTSSRCKSVQRSQSVCSKKVESKYLGTLKVLDLKVPQDSQPQAADSLRAAIYQEWLKKKREKSREKMQLLKKEEILKGEKKKEEETKREDAAASYEAWKDKKTERLQAKAKEKQNMIKKEQRMIEEREEKRQSARQVFEKWKSEHDDLLREKCRKKREAERKLKQKNQKEGEERKRDSRSSFLDWCEKKKDVLHNKVTTEREENKTKAEEDRYMQEERDKMALETYEHWLAKKDLDQKRQREERRIQAILRDSPPPPWSPPNKTIPFRK